MGLAIHLGYLVPPSILFIPLATMVYRLGLFDTPFALILVYPTFLVPFCTWLLIGYFKSIPYELEECALVVRRHRLQILRRICRWRSRVDLGWNILLHPVLERVHLCPGLHPVSEKETVPVAILTG